MSKRGYSIMCSCVCVVMDIITRTNHQVYEQIYFQMIKKDFLTIKAVWIWNKLLCEVAHSPSAEVCRGRVATCQPRGEQNSEAESGWTEGPVTLKF